MLSPSLELLAGGVAWVGNCLHNQGFAMHLVFVAD